MIKCVGLLGCVRVSVLVLSHISLTSSLPHPYHVVFVHKKKRKMMIVDFRRTCGDHCPLHINGAKLERVKSYKYFGVHITDDPTWTLNTICLSRKKKTLSILTSYRGAKLPTSILTTFYRETIKSIMKSCLTVWYGNCTISDAKNLQHIIRMAENIIVVSIPTTENLYHKYCICKATSIDPHMNCSHCCHLAHGMGESVPPPLDSTTALSLRRSVRLTHFCPQHPPGLIKTLPNAHP